MSVLRVLKRYLGSFYCKSRNLLLSKLGLRRFYFWQLARKNKIDTKIVYDCLIYCEQPSHWQNVVLIVDAFIRKFPDQEILLITAFKPEAYPDARYPKGLRVFQGLPPRYYKNFQAKVLLTPHVGFPRQLKPQGSIVIHALVSFTSLDGVYAESMFYGYDYILCAGPHHLDDFKRWSSMFPQLRGKTLIPAGYPKLDLLLQELAICPQLKPTEKMTVVYAPTHVYAVNEKLASLRKHGREIVSHLLGLGYRVIFRPHPVSFNDSDRFLVDEIACTHSGNPDFELDASKEYFSAYSKADVMVTDLSGTGFTFSFTFTKPAIFFVEDRQAESQLTGVQFEEREKIGFVARSIEDLEMALKNLDTIDWSGKIREYRAVKVFNLGSSGEYAAESISKILCSQKSDDWVSI